MSAHLTLIDGGGDIIAVLEAMLQSAKSGELEAVAVITCTTDRVQNAHYAYRDDMAFAWARLVAAAGCFHAGLMADGL